MNPVFRAAQGGFTLVEIAVALVIIGLLLGGILKGQELISNARTHSLADQHASIQTAFYAFQDRFMRLPGDMRNDDARAAIGHTVNQGAAYGGDGDGRLDDGSFQEVSALWHHLAAAGFVQGSFSGGASDIYGYTAGDVAPTNTFNGRLMVANLDEYLDAATMPPLRTGFIFGGNVPVKILRQLDAKLDDGKPATGSLRATTPHAVGPRNYSGIVRSAASCVSGTGADALWAVDSNADDCNAVYLY